MQGRLYILLHIQNVKLSMLHLVKVYKLNYSQSWIILKWFIVNYINSHCIQLVSDTLTLNIDVENVAIVKVDMSTINSMIQLASDR